MADIVITLADPSIPAGGSTTFTAEVTGLAEPTDIELTVSGAVKGTPIAANATLHVDGEAADGPLTASADSGTVSETGPNAWSIQA